MKPSTFSYPLRAALLLAVIILAAGGATGFAPLPRLQTAPLPTQPASLPTGEIRDFAQLDPDSGWLLLGQGLFWTDDGGNTWVEITPPGVELTWSVQFLDEQNGLALISPPVADLESPLLFQLAVTTDGGLSWESRPVLAANPPEFAPELEAPAEINLSFSDLQNGAAYFKRATSSNFEVGTLLTTADGGLTWTAAEALDGAPSAEAGPQRVQSAGVVWEVQTESACPTKQTCTQTQHLARSTDGGGSWEPLPLPADYTPPVQPVAAPELLAQGHGFDKCEIPTLAQLQEWWLNSPYGTVNLYFGGSARSCSNKALNAAYLSQLDRQGWKYIPTWVGPQAACTNYKSRMDYNPSIAYQQGINEANLAANAAAALQLWGQALYYDLEAFETTDTACLNAARAFMNGWSYQMHLLGYPAGVYGTPCRSGLPDFWTLSHRPEAVWIAHWIYPSYNPAATVWTSICGFSNTYWPNQQRLRQYAGGHWETWGTVSLIIDSNVLDGYIAQAYGQPQAACPRPASPAVAGAILYTAADYDCYNRQSNYGYTWFDRPGFNNLSAFFENRASSIYLPPGWSARLYDGMNKTGAKLCMEASTSDFAGKTYDNGLAVDNTASSIEIFNAPGCQAGLPLIPPSDTQPPVVSITSHASGDYLPGSALPILVQAEIQDVISGASHAQFFAGYADAGGWSWHSLGYDLDGGDGWSAGWTPSGLSSLDEIGFYVFAWDQAGNGGGASVLHLNLGDSQPPVSAIQPLPAAVENTIFRLAWQGTDDISGLAAFDLQVQVDGGAWEDWLVDLNPATTSAVYYGEFGHSYGFRLRARDRAGNQEAYPAVAQATTTINPCTPDAYEPDNSLAAAKTLEPGQAQRHNLCALGDADWLSIELEAGKTYYFKTANLGEFTEARLSLWDGQGKLLAENANPGTNPVALIFYRSMADGPVYLKVVSADLRIAGTDITYEVSAGQAELFYLPMVRR